MEPVGGLRIPGVSPAVWLLAAGLLLMACGDDTGSDTTASTAGSTAASSDDIGPNPTVDDPGPNDTSDGPETVQGTVVLTENCIVIATDSGDLALDFAGRYTAETLADGLAVVDDEGAAVAREGDSMIVAGFRTDTDAECGKGFDVDSLVNVTPQ